MAAALRQAEHHVRVIANGASAWRELSEHPDAYDLLVIDLSLPGMDGAELVRRIRGAGSNQPILVVSGRLATGETDAFDRAAVEHVLPKPFTNEGFLAVVESCLAAKASDTPGSTRPSPGLPT